ncbi:MAG: 23S rRNA (pseudouridine(1915)-N(3))-methyltransferase RlmH [Bacteroidales bacterium]
MQATLLLLGKTEAPYLIEGIDKYAKRIKRYIKFDVKLIPSLKNTKKLTIEEQKKKEGTLILQHCANYDHIILLDEKGKELDSIEFSKTVEEIMRRSIRKVCFVVGGPYGFDKDVYVRADWKLSLSKMTYSHQMIRLLFVEQLYRTFTIINNEPYHHE